MIFGELRGEKRGGRLDEGASARAGDFGSAPAPACFLVSNMRVPAASSMRPRISCGFMLSTLVIRPCMICTAKRRALSTHRGNEGGNVCSRAYAPKSGGC